MDQIDPYPEEEEKKPYGEAAMEFFLLLFASKHIFIAITKLRHSC
jgi:hypothetical protein